METLKTSLAPGIRPPTGPPAGSWDGLVRGAFAHGCCKGGANQDGSRETCLHPQGRASDLLTWRTTVDAHDQTLPCLQSGGRSQGASQ